MSSEIDVEFAAGVRGLARDVADDLAAAGVDVAPFAEVRRRVTLACEAAAATVRAKFGGALAARRASITTHNTVQLIADLRAAAAEPANAEYAPLLAGLETAFAAAPPARVAHYFGVVADLLELYDL